MKRYNEHSIRKAEIAQRGAIEQDLSRFLPPGALEVHRKAGYREFIDAVRELCREIKAMGIGAA